MWLDAAISCQEDVSARFTRRATIGGWYPGRVVLARACWGHLVRDLPRFLRPTAPAHFFRDLIALAPDHLALGEGDLRGVDVAAAYSRSPSQRGPSSPGQVGGHDADGLAPRSTIWP